MRIRVKYLRHDSYRITLQISTTSIDEVIIGSTFVQVFAKLQPLRLFYWVYLRLPKSLPFNRKAKLKKKILFRPRTLVSLKKRFDFRCLIIVLATCSLCWNLVTTWVSYKWMWNNLLDSGTTWFKKYLHFPFFSKFTGQWMKTLRSSCF